MRRLATAQPLEAHGRPLAGLLEPQTEPRPQAPEVDVWRAWLDASTAPTVQWLESLLAPDERERMQGFYFARDRRRYAVGRGTLRVILGRYLSRAPEELRFAYGPSGKPRLEENEVYFNVAHSEGLALFAVTRAGEVGVDVERIRALPDCDEVARSAFAPRELAKLEACSPERRQAEFFHAWARQEAVLKALGVGLGGVKGADMERGFAVYPLKVDEGHAAALAVAAGEGGSKSGTISEQVTSRRSEGRSVTGPGSELNFS